MSLVVTLLVSFLVLVSPAAAPAAAASISLENEYVALTFDKGSLALQSVVSKLHDPPYPLTAPSQPNVDWWSATLVSNTSAFDVTVSSPCDGVEAKRTSNGLALLWRSVAVGDKALGYTVDVAVAVALPAHSQLAEFRYSVTAVSGVLGLWSFTYAVHELPSAQSQSDDDDMFVLNHSYGALYTKPLLSQPTAMEATYPSNDGAYQFIAHYHVLNASAFPPTHAGLYVGTHDPSASYKLFRYQPDVSGGTLSLSVELRPADNNRPLPSESAVQSFPFVLGCFQGDWWDASQLYRNWSLSEAPWAQRSIRQRGDSFPQVMRSAQVWLNTGWQYHDVFNATQGDPAVVVQRVTTLAKRLSLGPEHLALHYYVFQNTSTFDAYYPVYFPAKPGFAEAVALLQDAGVTVAPYINGRIYDIDLPKWQDDDAQRYAAKSTPALLGFNLSLYYESYGNDVQQAAMCPFTRYWQQTYRNVSEQLARTYGVHGIYIDQVGAAAAQPCYDASHNHTLGDGTAWVEGYHAFLQGVLEAVGPTVAIVTESNAEPYMDSLHGYLTLTAFQHSVTGNDGQLVPVFPAIYGGYMMGFGAIFTVADLVDNTDSGYATLLAAQFVHGAQLGWMSLGGTSDDPPMGLYDYLMADEYEAEVDWLRLLATTRAVLSDYFLYGREMRQPPFVVNVTYSSNTASDTPAYLSSAWLLHNSSSTSLLVTLLVPDSTIAPGGLSFNLSLALADFGFPPTALKQRWQVWRWDGSGSSERVAVQAEPGNVIELSGTSSARSIVLLTVEQPASDSDARAIDQ